jgi:hypothetical protein
MFVDINADNPFHSFRSETPDTPKKHITLIGVNTFMINYSQIFNQMQINILNILLSIAVHFSERSEIILLFRTLVPLHLKILRFSHGFTCLPQAGPWDKLYYRL